MRVYLDNCAFNRPFDDLSQHRVRVESEAKLLIQQKIENAELHLVWSYINDTENLRNPIADNRIAILSWKDLAIELVFESALLLSKLGRFRPGASSRSTLYMLQRLPWDPSIFL